MSAEPSTVNNNGSNFEPTVTNPFPSWNPMGNHYWQFMNCAVTTAFDKTPDFALTLPSAVTTDANGSARFQMMASDPGNPARVH